MTKEPNEEKNLNFQCESNVPQMILADQYITILLTIYHSADNLLCIVRPISIEKIYITVGRVMKKSSLVKISMEPAFEVLKFFVQLRNLHPCWCQFRTQVHLISNIACHQIMGYLSFSFK